MRTILGAFLALALLFAGCSSEPDATTTTTMTVPPPAVLPAFTVDNGATGCYEAVGLLLVDLAVAQAALPANWTAADAQVALGAPQPTGRGAIWFNAYTCSNSTMARGALGAGEFGILVHPPRLSTNATGAAATFNVYEVLHFTDSAAQRATLASVNVTSRTANVTIARDQVSASIESAQVRVGNATSAAYSFSYTAILPDTFNGTADFWHATSEGMTVFHFSIDTTPVLQGSVTACSFADPEAQRVTGIAACTPGTQAIVVVIPQQAWTSEFRWMPGVRAVAQEA